MPMIDFECQACGATWESFLHPSKVSEEQRCRCGGPATRVYSFTNPPAVPVPCHPSEASVVYRNPATGAVRYPGRNDVPMPERYAAQGYERVEMRTVHEIERFEKQQGVRNEAVWFDRNGKGFDTED